MQTNFSREVTAVNVRLATEADAGLKWFDHTTLTAINTCPVWGMVRYVKQLAMPGAGRAMALEAGIASHQVYSAVRLLDLLRFQERPDHFQQAGLRLYGETLWQRMLERLGDADDFRRESLNFSLQALYDSGYYDDPRDKRRTMANIEEACIAYIDKWPWGRRPIWIEDDNDPRSLVGIELPLEFVIEFTTSEGEVYAYRYLGRCDGLHYTGKDTDELELAENKTASRLDDAWQQSFLMSHQITGYLVGISLLCGRQVRRARVHGMAIPLPRTYDYGGIVEEPVTREEHQLSAWLQWVWDTTRIYEKFKDNVDGATRFTHSCNRYFRPCSMIPYCTADDEEREQIMSELVEETWKSLRRDTSMR